MKNLIIGILLTAAVVFGSLCLHQARKASQAQARADGLQQKVGELQSGLEAQEGQNFKFTTDLADRSKLTGDLASMFTEEKMSAYFQEAGQLNQQ